LISIKQTNHIYILWQNPGRGIPVSSLFLALFSNLHFFFPNLTWQQFFVARNTVNKPLLLWNTWNEKQNSKQRCTKITLYYPRQMYVYLKYLTIQISQSLLFCRAIQKAWYTLHSVGLLFHFFKNLKLRYFQNAICFLYEFMVD
jgi:hypothetical protein